MRVFPSSLPRLFAEFKRRKVFRVMAVYGATSFVVLQAAELMLPRLGLPDWTVTFLVVLVVLAFPVVLMIAWAFELTPDGVRKTDEAAPEEIDHIVSQPASRRWPSGLTALAGIVALAVGALWVGRQTAPGVVDTAADAGTPQAGRPLALADSEDDSRPSLAVLPFVNVSADPDQEYFSDGITEELLNTLARISDLKVIARTSAFAFKGRQLDMRDVGDRLGVEYLVEGSVRKAGSQLRITAQLIDAEDGSHLWSDQYDRELGDVFAIQTEIAQAIATELLVPLRLDEAEKLVTSTADLDAYDLYLEGRARTKERGEKLADAVRLFEAAIARDSSWAPAWAGLAEALEIIGWYEAAWEEQPADEVDRQAIRDAFWDRAEQAAQRTLELHADNASAHVALGSVLRNRRQWEASEASYLAALNSDPDNAEAYQQYSQLLFYVGRAVESVRVARRAVALDRSAARMLALAAALMSAGHDEEALEVVEEGMRLDPEGHISGGLSTIKMQILLGSRRFEALGELFTGAGWPPELANQVVEALHAGEFSDLPTELRNGLQSTPLFLMPIGQHDKAARALLEQARADPLLALQVMWMPLFDPIREHPAYLETLRVLNLDDP